MEQNKRSGRGKTQLLGPDHNRRLLSETKKIEGTAFLGKRSTNPFFFYPSPHALLC
jgi:hypothetical protein